MRISIHKTSRVLLFSALVLCVAGWVTQYYALVNKTEFFASKDSRGFVRYFYLAGEANIPSWFQSATLALCALLLIAISVRKQPFRFHWRALSALFLYLSLEEAASILEGFAYRLLRILPFTPSYLAILGVALLVVGYWRFMSWLPVKSRVRFIAAGIIYVSGAIGLEMIGSFLEDFFSAHRIFYLTRTVIEEGLEFLGIVLFLRALLLHIKEETADEDGARQAGEASTVRFTIVD
jgi:hypothetical protein